MTETEVLHTVLDRLGHHNIPYMITGSFAGNLYGVPRATHDADLVIECDAATLQKFLDSFDSSFYTPKDEARQALLHKTMFNIIHATTGFKVDCIIRKEREFSSVEFQRRRPLLFLNEQRWFATPEDVILVKLEWSRDGESSRQFEDAVSIARRIKNLDQEYLLKWSRVLGVSDQLDRLLHQSRSA